MTILGSQRTSLQEELARLLEQPATGSGLPNAARIRLSDAPHVAELAQLALHLRSVPIARPDPDFRAALRTRLLQAATARSPAPAVRRARGRLAAWRRSVNLALASALSACAIGGAGVTVAAAHAQPDELLYHLKLAGESLRLALADGGAELGRLELVFAERRLAEVTAGARDLPADTLVDTLKRMDASGLAGARELLMAYRYSGERAHLDAVAGFAARQRAGLREVIPKLPAEVVPFARRSLEAVSQIRVQAAGLMTTACSLCVEEASSLRPPVAGPVVELPCCTGDPGPTAERRDAVAPQEVILGPHSAAETTDPSSEPGLRQPQGSAPPQPLPLDVPMVPAPEAGGDGLDPDAGTAVEGLDGLVATTPAVLTPLEPTPPILAQPTPTRFMPPPPLPLPADDLVEEPSIPADGHGQ